jgi:hypothetical protein
MPNDQPPRPTTGGPTRRHLVAGGLVALIVVGVAVGLIIRDENRQSAPSSTTSGPRVSMAPTTTTSQSPRAEVIARLQQILKIRERALGERNANLLDSIYTSDCSCLKAGRDAIAALKRENIIWRDRSISIEIQSTKRINDRLWEVSALFKSEPFRIETEVGRLVRESPAERLRYRFLLVRISKQEPWRLGSASLVERS